MSPETAALMKESKSPLVIVISGPNGAGKTTLAPRLLRDAFGILEYVNADPIALGLSAFEPERAAREAGRVMLKRIRSLASKQMDFAFETTLASRSYAGWIRTLQNVGYSFHLLFLWLDGADLAVQRVRERVRSGGHSVPEDVARRRYARGIQNFFQLYQPLAETWAMYDNSTVNRPFLVAIGGKDRTLKIFDREKWQKIEKSSEQNL